MTSALLVTRAFPPYAPSLGGAVRILKLAEYLNSEGVQVHVLAGKGREYGDFGYGHLLRSISVHYIPDPVLERTGPSASPGEAKPASGVRSLMRPILTECSVPDTGIFAYRRLVKAANELVVKYQIPNIVTSGPPHSDHLVGLAVKRKFGARLNWIVDYRDSWNGTSLFRKRNLVLQKVNLTLERRVLKRADHFTFISEPMLEKAAKLVGAASAELLRKKAILVMNGYDARAMRVQNEWSPRDARLRIGYFGALDDRPDSYRNPCGIFEAIAADHPDVAIELYGQIRISPRWSEVLGDRIRIGGMLSHSESLERMAGMDALMLLHTREDGADEVLTGKIFEYLLSGRPVLSIGPEKMAANALLRKLNTGYSVRHDDPLALGGTLRVLKQLKDTGALGTVVPVGIEQFSRDYQYSRLKSLLSDRSRENA